MFRFSLSYILCFKCYQCLWNVHSRFHLRFSLTFFLYLELLLYQGAVLFYYSQRGREGRLIRLLSDTRRSKHGVDWGIGIDENTALVVSHVGTHQSKAEV